MLFSKMIFERCGRIFNQNPISDFQMEELKKDIRPLTQNNIRFNKEAEKWDLYNLVSITLKILDLLF